MCVLTGAVSNSMIKWTDQECAHILSYRTVMKMYFLLKQCTRKRHWSCDKTLSLLRLLLVIWNFSKKYSNEFCCSGRKVLCFEWGRWGAGSKSKEVHVPVFPVLHGALWQPVGWFWAKALTSPIEIASIWFVRNTRTLIFTTFFSAFSSLWDFNEDEKTQIWKLFLSRVQARSLLVWIMIHELKLNRSVKYTF